MTEVELMVMSTELKLLQEEMRSSVSVLLDIIIGLQERTGILAEKWEGGAAEGFLDKLTQAQENAYKQAQRLNKGISALGEIEKETQTCEQKVKEHLAWKGTGNRWRFWENF